MTETADPFDQLDDLSEEEIGTLTQRAALPRNDLGNARRLIAQHGSEMAYVIGVGWSVWDGKRFRGGEAGMHAAVERAHAVADKVVDEAWALYRKAETYGKEEAKHKSLRAQGEALHKWAVRCGERGKTSAMLGQAESLLRTELSQFDMDPLAVNAANGLLRFSLVEREAGGIEDVEVIFSPHDPAARCTRVAGGAWNPDAAAPRWQVLAPEWAGHLEKILPDAEVRDFLQRAMGYALTGLTREQCMFMLQGRGGDGKSLTIAVIRAAMGDYSAVSDVRTWLDAGPRGGDGPSEDRARLAGASRLVSSAEPPQGSALNDELLKKFTGGDTMTARGLNLPTFEFDPVGKLVMEVNQKPRVKGDDDGIWRRIWVVPFRVQFKEDQQDKGLKKRLIDNEIDGVFAWLVEGAREYLRKGLAPPEVIREAVNAYRAEANPFGEWYRECCILDPDAEEPAQDLFASYCEWCELQGYEPVKQAAFGRSLATKQHPKGKANVEGRRGVIVRKGLRLDNIRVLEISADLAAKRAAEGGGTGGRKRGGEDLF